MDTVRTLSDTKRSFYSHHQRPINSIYRRAVEELMVEMHLLSVNSDFHYDPIYALGVVTAFNRFLQGYAPESDRQSIFAALCRSIEAEPQPYRQDAERLQELAQTTSPDGVVACLRSLTPLAAAPEFERTLKAIAANDRFKYSRLFAIGLYTLLESADTSLVSEDERRQETLKQIAQNLNLPFEKLDKDLALYRDNLEKMAQALAVVEDAIAASRKQRERRAAEKASLNPPSPPEPKSES